MDFRSIMTDIAAVACPAWDFWGRHNLYGRRCNRWLVPCVRPPAKPTSIASQLSMASVRQEAGAIQPGDNRPG